MRAGHDCVSSDSIASLPDGNAPHGIDAAAKYPSRGVGARPSGCRAGSDQPHDVGKNIRSGASLPRGAKWVAKISINASSPPGAPWKGIAALRRLAFSQTDQPRGGGALPRGQVDETRLATRTPKDDTCPADTAFRTLDTRWRTARSPVPCDFPQREPLLPPSALRACVERRLGAAQTGPIAPGRRSRTQVHVETHLLSSRVDSTHRERKLLEPEAVRDGCRSGVIIRADLTHRGSRQPRSPQKVRNKAVAVRSVRSVAADLGLPGGVIAVKRVSHNGELVDRACRGDVRDAYGAVRWRLPKWHVLYPRWPVMTLDEWRTVDAFVQPRKEGRAPTLGADAHRQVLTTAAVHHAIRRGQVVGPPGRQQRCQRQDRRAAQAGWRRHRAPFFGK
eukprot:scaffold77783_cov66-Phaeocystis_antarctica.AAC.5